MTTWTSVGRIAALTVAAGLVFTGCGSGGSAAGTPSADETGPVTIRFTWWGNDARSKITSEVIDQFQKANPNITVVGEPGEFASYWDKLATQVAGGSAPDVIQMDEKYLTEYGNRGALLDLSSVDTSKFAAGTVDSGKVKGTLLAINAGINAPVIVANPKVFADAGATIPDDTTWTWDQYAALGKEISAKGAGAYYGIQSLAGVDGATKAWIRQSGKQQFTEDGIGFTATEIQKWFEFWKANQDSGAAPAASVTAEDEGKSLDQSLNGTNKAALGFQWSNQITAIDKATGQDVKLLRLPSQTGKASDAELWYKASMYWSANAKTQHPAAVKKFIDFLANNVGAGKTMGTERGVPANTDVRAALSSQLSASDTKVIAYLNAIESELGDPSIVPPQGAGTSEATQRRYSQSMLFGKSTPADAAKGFVDELKGQIVS